MNSKIAIAVSCALSLSFASLPATAKDGVTTSNNKPYTATHTSGKAVYIVELEEQPVASYQGGIQGLTATKTLSKKARLNVNNEAVQQYRTYLRNRQQAVLDSMPDTVASPVARYQLAYNGFAIKLSPSEAKQLRQTAGVKSVKQDRVYSLNAYVGPATVGAPQMWDGSATSSGSDTLGEGTVIAVLDTGINSDHPSFADIGGDGYNHTNPLGSGTYLGDCRSQFPALCNDKLIGVYSYPAILSAYSDTDIFPSDLPRNGEDYNGHGSHVASTAAGNILYNAPEVIPDYDATASSGVETGYVFEELSGVAPHANIISYQVCEPGEEDDTYNGCLESVMLQAVEDVIDSNIVDVINFSISGGDFPWDTALNRAWLNAHNAGIFLAQSAGNDGPDSATTDKHAPWLTSVAATTHGTNVVYEKTISNFSGGTFTPATISGNSNSGAITASVVYAGDYTNSNDPGGDPAQCLEPFPANTFNGQIVVCDRGEIARIQKAVNVAEGGAGGYILANIQGGETFLANDAYVVPGIHISANDGDELKRWLASGSNHRATISAGELSVDVDSTTADNVAEFSSRGPNTSISTLTPMLAAPGVEIYAAWADEHYGHEESGTAPADYAYSSGTSMASPHVAGAALLLKQDHPGWTPDNIRSALMMTAVTNVQLDDGQTDANWFDMGAGRIQVDLATQSGLIMNETYANYEAANPQIGGEPRNLNIPAVVDENCVTSCTWSRTVTATKSGSWQVSGNAITSGLSVSVSPASFSLSSGQSQKLTFTVTTGSVPNYQWAFGNVSLTSASSPDLHVPVAVYASNGNIPQFVDVEAHRNQDSVLLKDLLAAEIESFNYQSYGLTPVTSDTLSLPTDSTPDDLFDNTAGVSITTIEVPANALRLYAETYDSQAYDLDLYLAYDSDGNGEPSDDEIRAESTSVYADEMVDKLNPQAGTWFIIVQNFQGSSDTATDNFTLDYVLVDADDEGNLTLQGPASSPAQTAFDLRVIWDLANASEGDRFFGAFALGSNANSATNIGVSHIELVRGEDDVYLSSPDGGRVNIGDQHTLNVNVLDNTSGEDRTYEIDVTLPDTVTLVPASITGNATLSGNTISWQVTQPDMESTDAQSTQANTTLAFDVIVEDTASTGPIPFELASRITNVPGADSKVSKTYEGLQIDGAPVVTIAGTDAATATLAVGSTVSFTADVSEPNGDAVTYRWTQISGPVATLLNSSTDTVTVAAPSDYSATPMVFEVVASDPAGNSDSARVTVTLVENSAPVLSVTSPSTVTAGSTITIRATATDADGDTLVFTINDVEGSVYSTQATSASAGTNVSFVVTVSDGINVVSQTVSVAVTARASSGGGGGGGSTGWLMLLLIPVILLRRINK